MCGRITRTSPREAIAKEFGVTRFAEVDWHPRYNVAPSQMVETIISVPELVAHDSLFGTPYSSQKRFRLGARNMPFRVGFGVMLMC